MTIEASAQSAQDTASYIVFGIKPGDRIQVNGHPLVFSRNRNYDNVSQGMGPFSTFTQYSKAETPCKYVEVYGDGRYAYNVTLDFTDLKSGQIKKDSNSISGKVVVLKGVRVERCLEKDAKTGEFGDCKGAPPTFATPERLEKAIAYFQQNFCKPSAF